MENLFAVTSPGLEPFTARELLELKLIPNPSSASTAHSKEWPGWQDGGIAFQGGMEAVYLANLHLRTASRVLLRLGEFEAIGFSELRKRASRLDWGRYLAPGTPLAIRATCHKSRLYHSDAVAQRIAEAVSICLGKKAPLAKPDQTLDGKLAQLIVVRLLHDHCTISLDTSGELLHRRGYRLETAKAPLRETLAAGLVLASGWDAASPLLDPFCGSGTIAIEAALIANRLPPGRGRHFAFMDWSGYNPQRWKKLLDQASQYTSPRSNNPVVIQASDRDAGAVEIAQANAQRAGVAGKIEFTRGAVSAITPPGGPGWVTTNPPYGLRVRSSKDLRDLYAQFGNVLRMKCPGWQAAILSNDLALLGQTSLALDTSLVLVNGGVAVRLGLGKVDELR